MPLPPPARPETSFATILQWLSGAVATQGIMGRLAGPIVVLIIDRIRGINQRVARLAARIRAGRYAPRRIGPRRPPALRRPRPPNPLPRQSCWLQTLVPEAVQYRAQLEYLLRDPEMAALLAAAPAAMRRPLRSLCHMLGVTPPDILALPAKPRPPRKIPPAAPQEPPAPRPALPEWLQDRRKPWSLARIRGSPHRA